MGRKIGWVGVGALAFASLALGQSEPPELRSGADRCVDLFASEPLPDHSANAGRAAACIAEACRGPSNDPLEVEVALRVDGAGRARARIVRGTLGDRARDQCVTRILGRTPFAAEPGRARATLDVGGVLILSSLDTLPGRAEAPRARPQGDRPTRDQVMTELMRVRPLVGACLAEEERRVVPIRLTFGSDGRVQRVEPGGQLPEAAARCARHALERTVRLPPFRDETFTVVFPFRREPGDDAVTVESLDQRVARLPAAMRNGACEAMVLSPPAGTVREAIDRSIGCAFESCNPHFESSGIALDFEIRFRESRARAQLVRGSVGDGATKRCVERALRYAPYPEDAAGHRRVRVKGTSASLALRPSP